MKALANQASTQIQDKWRYSLRDPLPLIQNSINIEIIDTLNHEVVVPAVIFTMLAPELLNDRLQTKHVAPTCMQESCPQKRREKKRKKRERKEQKEKNADETSKSTSADPSRMRSNYHQAKRQPDLSASFEKNNEGS